MGYSNVICGIYMIRNKVNDKKYIGKSLNIYARWANHISKLRRGLHENRYLQRSWDRYGEDNFEFSVVEVCNKEIASKLEIYYIQTYNTNSFDSNGKRIGYNLTKGGEGILGKRLTEEHKQKLRLYHTGKKASIETRKKMSESKKGKFYGKSGNDSPNAVKVVCLNNRKIYGSMAEAESETGVMSIHKACSGISKYRGRDSDGLFLVWRYYNDYVNLSEDEIKNIVLEVNRKNIFILINTKEIVAYNKMKEICDSMGKVYNACNGVTKSIIINNKNEKIMYYYDYIKNGDTTCDVCGKFSTIQKLQKGVTCVTTNMTFDSILAAAKYYNIKSYQKIGMVCRGKRKSCGTFNGEKLVWVYTLAAMGLNPDGTPIE